MQTQLSTSPSHSILTQGQPVSADPITPGAGQGSTGVPISSHWYGSTPEKSRRKRDSNPGSSALEADALTTRPTRRSLLAETASVAKRWGVRLKSRDPGFASRFAQTNNTSDLESDTLVISPPGACDWTGWPCLSIL